MAIIIKHVLKSILEKKIRTALIIFAVTISSALLFASVSISDILIDLYVKEIVQTTGNADILITSNIESPSFFLDSELTDELSDELDFSIGGINSLVDYQVEEDKNDSMNLLGIDLDEYLTLNSLTILENESVKSSFDDDEIIISRYTADKYNLKINDIMKFTINGTEQELEVAAIAASSGLFLNEANLKFGIVPFETMSDYVGSEGKPNTLYIKANEEEDIDSLIEDLQSIYLGYDVERPYSEQEFKEKAATFSIPLLLTTIMICFLSIFIIYSTFKVILLEKLPIIGTFRSVGASKKNVNRVILLESLFYGSIGGALACMLGIVILYGLTYITTPSEVREVVGLEVNYSTTMLIITFLFSNFICLISTFMPIVKVSKIPLRDVILNTTNMKQRNSFVKSILAIGCISIAVILPTIELREYTLMGLLMVMACTIIGVINIIPLLVKITTKSLNKLSMLLLGNSGVVGLIKGDKSMVNSISLITLGVSILLMINTATSNMGNELIDAVGSTMIYDLSISFNGMDDTHIDTISEYDEVEGVYPFNQVQNIKLKGLDDKIAMIDGVSGIDYAKYIDVNYIGDESEALDKLQDERSIIITRILQKRYGIKEGDELILEMPEGDITYQVIGFADTMMNAGGYALIGAKYLKEDSGQEYYTGAYINAKSNIDTIDFKEELRSEFKEYNPATQTLIEFKQGFEQGHKQMTSMLGGFTGLALIIGIIGVVNNLIISFIERKRSIAVLKSIGMSKKQAIKMVFVEAIFMGMIGSILGIVGGSMLISVIPMGMEVMKVAMPVRHMPELFSYYILAGFFVTMISSISPALRASKLNIIEAIKYE